MEREEALRAIQLNLQVKSRSSIKSPAMAHLTCVCATKESINTALTEMKQAGIENILALRGDIPKDYDGEVFTEFQHAFTACRTD